MLCIFYCLKLIIRFLERKHFLKLFLPDSIRSIYKSFRLLSDRVQFYKIFRYNLNSFLYLAFCFSPLDRSEFIQPRFLCIRSCIFLDQIHLCHRYIQDSAFGIDDLHIIFYDLLYFNFFNSFIYADSMIFVNNVISGFQLGKILNPLTFILFAFFLFLFSSENIRLRNNDKFKHRILIPFWRIAVRCHDLARFYFPLHIFTVKTAQIIVS